MSFIFSNNFIKSINRGLDDCSNPLQLRNYLNKYSNYVFTAEILNSFNNRIDQFKELFYNDMFYNNLLIEIVDELDIIMLNKGDIDNFSNLDDNIDISLVNDANFDFNNESEKNTLIKVFEYSNGNKSNICLMLDVTVEVLNKKIIQYKLKGILNDIRRNYRNNSNIKG